MVPMMEHAGNYLRKKDIKGDCVKKDVDLGGIGIKHHFKYMLYGDGYSTAVDVFK